MRTITMVEVMRKKTMVMVVAMAVVLMDSCKHREGNIARAVLATYEPTYVRKTRSLRWEPLNRIFVACTYRWLEAVAMHLAGSRFG